MHQVHALFRQRLAAELSHWPFCLSSAQANRFSTATGIVERREHRARCFRKSGANSISSWRNRAGHRATSGQAQRRLAYVSQNAACQGFPLPELRCTGLAKSPPARATRRRNPAASNRPAARRAVPRRQGVPPPATPARALACGGAIEAVDEDQEVAAGAKAQPLVDGDRARLNDHNARRSSGLGTLKTGGSCGIPSARPAPAAARTDMRRAPPPRAGDG